MKKHWIITSAIAIALLSSVDATPAAAQSCNDRWVTQAIRETTGRAPQGSGNSGECNIDRYGAGSWTSYQDLKTRVQKSYICRDPWIGQVIFYTYNRNPNGSGTAGECNIYLYGNGSWSGYMDLAGKVKQAVDKLSSSNLRFDTRGNLLNAQTGRLDTPASQLRIVTSSGVVAAGGGNVVAAGGLNLIAPGGGNVVAAGGLNLIPLAGGSMIGRVR